jgi:hypothetical protein
MGNIKKEEAVKSITQAIIDGGQESLIKMINLLKSKNVETESLPDNIDDGTKEFIVFLLTEELICLPNIFEEDIAREIKSLSIDYLSKNLNYNQEDLIKIIKIYENRFNEDINSGINPFDSLGILAILCERLGFKKTVKIGRTKNFSPILTTVLGTFTRPGRWKMISEKYQII